MNKRPILLVILGLLFLGGCTMLIPQPSGVLETARAVGQGQATLESLRLVAEENEEPPQSSLQLCAIDGNRDGYIDDAEILEAIAAWVGGTPIGGYTIDDATLLEAVAAWVLQTELICPSRKVGGTQVRVYWTERTSSSKKIRRAYPNGSSPEDLVDCQGYPRHIALDPVGGKMYWTEGKRIRRANLDGTQAETIVTGLEWAEGIDVAGGKIYWTDWGTKKIQRADLDGSHVEDLVTSGLTSPKGIAVDLTLGREKIYWVDEFRKAIKRANLDGSGVEKLVSLTYAYPADIALDVAGGKMYWIANGDIEEGIHRANLDGSSVKKLHGFLSGGYGALALNIPGGKIYVTNGMLGTLCWCDLDGRLGGCFSGVVAPSGVAILR